MTTNIGALFKTANIHGSKRLSGNFRFEYVQFVFLVKWSPQHEFTKQALPLKPAPRTEFQVCEFDYRIKMATRV